MAHSSNEDSSREIWVNSFTEQSALKFRNQVLKWADKGEGVVIPVFIDSYGGQVDSLANMIETMDSVPNMFVTICMGKAMSCGAIMLSHGDIRWCGARSRVMVHNVSSVSWGDAFQLQSGAEEAMRLNQIFLGLLAENCGITYEDLQEILKETTCGKELWLSANEAYQFGLIDHVGIPQINHSLKPHIDFSVEKERLTDKDKGIKSRKTYRKNRRTYT